MKANIKLLSLILASSLMVGCSGSTPKEEGKKDESITSETSQDEGEQSSDGSQGSEGSSESEPVTGSWDEVIQGEMMLYLGEVLPFVQLEEESLYHGYSDYYAAFGFGLYQVYDDSEVDLLTGYGDVLTLAGYEYVEDEGDIYYEKTTSLGDITVSYGWYAATEEESAGNVISVMCPLYVEPVTEESLIEAGYEKQTGFPREIVDTTMEGSGYTFPSVNDDGEWFVASELYVDEEEGYSYYCTYLATRGEYFDTYYESLTALGMVYDEDYECFLDGSEVSDFELYIYENNGFTLFDLFGQTLEPEEGDPISVVDNQDGSYTITFTFAGVLVDQTTLDGRTFETDYVDLTFHKGDSQTAPTYYSNGDTVRCYTKNTMDFEAKDALSIVDVELTIGSKKSLSGVASEFTVSSGSVSVEDDVATISDVNNKLLEVGIGMGATKGNLGFSKIEVTVK